MSWKIGDRIQAVKHDVIPAGAVGTVLIIDKRYDGSLSYGVRFDKYDSSLHNLDGSIPYGHGWWVIEDTQSIDDVSSFKLVTEGVSMNWKIGDRIRILDNKLMPAGSMATIKAIRAEAYIVEFDNSFRSGHSCNGVTHPERGWYVWRNYDNIVSFELVKGKNKNTSIVFKPIGNLEWIGQMPGDCVHVSFNRRSNKFHVASSWNHGGGYASGPGVKEYPDVDIPGSMNLVRFLKAMYGFKFEWDADDIDFRDLPQWA